MDNQLTFDSDKQEISCRTINTILKFVAYRGEDVKSIIGGLPYDEEYFSDANNWVSCQVANEISRRMRILFDDDEILYKVGLASEKLHTLGFVDYVTRLMGDPKFIIKHAPILNKYFSKVDDIEVINYGISNATVSYYSKPGYEMAADDCYYTKGIFTALPLIWKVGPVTVWEETCSVPIHKKGRMQGKFYTVDEGGYVSEHDVVKTKQKIDAPRIIGKLGPEGTFKLGSTTYGAGRCLYHISWPARKMWLKRIFYDLRIKPRVLDSTIEEMRRENDLIQQKYAELYQKNIQLQRHYVDTISAFVRALDAKDHYTKDHSLKVSLIAEKIAAQLRLSPNDIETIRQACKLHDLGKIGIKDSILLKSGKLTDEEWQEVKKHPVLGAQIIGPLAFLAEVAELIRQDHERWDGKGYPDGLKGEEIDLRARIIMVADAHDAMISGRVYKQPMTQSEAIEEIKRNSGTQFDPKVVEAFLQAIATEDQEK